MSTVIELAPGVRAGFTGRDGGVSREPYATLNLGGHVGDDPEAVAENRRRAARGFGLDPRDVVWMNQVHGADAVTVTGSGPAGDVDAVVTTVPGLALAVLVADCLPVLVADAEAGVVGAAHSGRPGMAAGVVASLVAEMERHGARPERCAALLGPVVCGRCYEVPEELQEEVARSVPEARCTTDAGTPGVDIRAGVTAQLKRLGVTNVTHDARCTRESTDLFSYRRDATTGRFAGYIWKA
ncbi:peptidoglycan editing factor PgeF [Thermobifida halotolerans]|uniref:Purine nucleoside phosphorylase n=1 Tax=Thermobifida halotolerans TaxID=483545 RepID=A0A399G4Q6_9ACTN|nr:peptidoglycan editing factor PgeF [Thermobifida halotolerans]UOE20227.1 peptidoglycan editing factor PgeF [Thermobifida halotolerans]